MPYRIDLGIPVLTEFATIYYYIEAHLLRNVTCIHFTLPSVIIATYYTFITALCFHKDETISQSNKIGLPPFRFKGFSPAHLRPTPVDYFKS
ncbi:hypothetical protein [Staphylococcus phage PT94]